MPKKITVFGNILVIILLAVSAFVWYRVLHVYSQPPETPELTVAFLNVGQGDSIFIKTPSNKHILIDGGTIPKEWSNFNAGAKVVVPYLQAKSICTLDIVIGTHPDLDHIGGLLAVLQTLKVNKFIDAGTISTTQTYQELLNLIDKKHIKYIIAKPGFIDIDPAIKLEILSPINEVFKEDSNNNSIVLRLEYNKVSFLLTADIGVAAEKYYIQKYGDHLRSDIMKIAHHGGKNSTSVELLNCALPSAAIISVGKNNPFGHPSKEVLDKLKNLGTTVYRTDKLGTIIIRTDGEKYRIFKEC